MFVTLSLTLYTGCFASLIQAYSLGLLSIRCNLRLGRYLGLFSFPTAMSERSYEGSKAEWPAYLGGSRVQSLGLPCSTPEAGPLTDFGLPKVEVYPKVEMVPKAEVPPMGPKVGASAAWVGTALLHCHLHGRDHVHAHGLVHVQMSVAAEGEQTAAAAAAALPASAGTVAEGCAVAAAVPASAVESVEATGATAVAAGAVSADAGEGKGSQNETDAAAAVEGAP